MYKPSVEVNGDVFCLDLNFHDKKCYIKRLRDDTTYYVCDNGDSPICFPIKELDNLNHALALFGGTVDTEYGVWTLLSEKPCNTGSGIGISMWYKDVNIFERMDSAWFPTVKEVVETCIKICRALT